MSPINLKALSKPELEAFVNATGLPAFRAKQLLHWIYERHARSVSDITEFSKELRERVAEKAYISNLQLLERLTDEDGTEKFLFGLEDGESIECVLIPDDERLTLCISSQVGCAMNCRFCLTGSMGIIRNLMPHEIVDQVISVGRIIKTQPSVYSSVGGVITNIVFMGMGEPLANIDNVAEALKRITGLMKISPGRITVSTSGIASKIPALALEAPKVKLAVSLNATTDSVRDYIMPVNRTYPLKTLLDACRNFPLPPRSRITFEYVLLKGVNDTPDDARRLVRLLKGIPSKVNLIPFNACQGSEFQRPDDKSVLKFQDILVKAHMTAIVRKSRGQGILAACGQLRAHYA
ncbi:MAG: 23S rRNA (adenine(2503)-C(2))-methyltransferase RlmN [Nitrospirae bacterium]|nr:23S rRNA (adenine(2503)-C(2))-methyltransferase RlmN [Nitrospirota bacterium]